MKGILRQYIVKHVLQAIGLVCLMLLGLQCFMLFVGELGAIGQGGYGIGSAFLFVLMKLPYHLYLFFPVTCLMGLLLGLGMMANQNELTVIRASGVSPVQIARAIFKVIAVLVVVVALLGELVLPKLSRYSEEWKALQRSGGQALQTAHGAWLRQKNHFIHIEQVLSSKILKGIQQYEFNDNHDLIKARTIDSARYHDGQWHLSGVKQTLLPSLAKTNKPLTVRAQHFKSLPWDISLPPNLLVGVDNNPNEMTFPELIHLILAKRHAHLEATEFEVSFWRRALQPISTFVMMLLAMPFIFGSTRSMTIAQRFMIGTSVGFLFHLLNEFVIPVSQIYQVKPWLAASLPTAVFAVLGGVLLHRRR